jgi:hypothetical protein
MDDDSHLQLQEYLRPLLPSPGGATLPVCPRLLENRAIA